jgi:hypothetical protein
MTIHLSALGWVDDAPRGNRLRWHYPVQDVLSKTRYVGLPETVIIERAPLDRQNLFEARESTSPYPYLWWDAQGDVTLFAFVPPYEHALSTPVQAVTFTYRGTPGRIVIRDSASSRVVLDRAVASGDVLYAEAPRIDSILLFAFGGTLENLRTLDLFRDRGLPFEPIAEIAVDASYTADLDTVARRYNQPATLSPSEWAELRQLAADAKASSPVTAAAGEPSAWDNLAVVLGLRWEFALLGGFAFFDGPRVERSDLDRLSDAILNELPSTMLAYRVVDRDGPGGYSNLVVCPPWLAAPLSSPSPPWYLVPEVRLHARKAATVTAPVLAGHPSLKNFSPMLEFEDDFGVRTSMGWQQNDRRALGVEIEEAVSASLTTGAPGRRTRFMSRSRRVEDPPLQGSVARSFDVSFPDVTLQARARALDAWDRLSDFSGWSSPTLLSLLHEPLAPPLETARYDAGTVRIMRAVSRPDVPDWRPDPLVARVGGQVFVYRRVVPPRVAGVTVGVPVPVTPSLYRATVTGAPNLADFVGGTLSVGDFTETIVAAGTASVDVAVPDNGGAVGLFSGGPARMSQNPAHSALWTHVASFPATALPAELVFSDPLPPSALLAIESYTTRLYYLGRLGPVGNIVGAVREPDVPVVPPPFVVQVLGVDFYHRTMLKLQFTTPPGAGRFTIWWAPGNVGATDFAKRGSTGTYGAQEAEGGLVLYDIIPTPLPIHVDGTVTIGVQRETDGGAQSGFVIAPVTLPAVAP